MIVDLLHDTELEYIKMEEKTINYIKEKIQEIKMEEDTPMRLSIYDSHGKFLGYKVDSAWTLHKELYKVHSFQDERAYNPLLKNLINILNHHGDCSLDGETVINSMNELYVVAEEVDDEGNFIQGLAGYHINRKNNKQFKLVA